MNCHPVPLDEPLRWWGPAASRIQCGFLDKNIVAQTYQGRKFFLDFRQMFDQPQPTFIGRGFLAAGRIKRPAGTELEKDQQTVFARGFCAIVWHIAAFLCW